MLRSKECHNRSDYFVSNPSDPCFAEDCLYGARCMVKADDTTRCICEKECVKETKPICGTDDKTYQNECELKRISCLKKKPISTTKEDSCSKIHIFIPSITTNFIVKLANSF